MLNADLLIIFQLTSTAPCVMFLCCLSGKFHCFHTLHSPHSSYELEAIISNCPSDNFCIPKGCMH